MRVFNSNVDFDLEHIRIDPNIIAGIIDLIPDEEFNTPLIKFFVTSNYLFESERILTWYIDINSRYRRLM